jgi:hypothetical protein
VETCLACKTENPDGAKYCKACGFTLRWREEDAPAEAPETQVMTAEIALRPSAVGVAAGSDAEAHIAWASGQAEWSVLGDAASFTSVSAAPGGATVHFRPGPAEPPRSLPVVIHGLVRGQSAIIVRGSVEVVAPVAPQQAPERRRPVGAILAVLAVAALVVLAIVVLAGGDGDGDGDGGGGGSDTIDAVIGRASGANVREDATDQSAVVTSLPQGEEVVVECAQDDSADGTRWARLVEPEGGRWVYAPFVLDRDSGEPVDLPDC